MPASGATVKVRIEAVSAWGKATEMVSKGLATGRIAAGEQSGASAAEATGFQPGLRPRASTDGGRAGMLHQPSGSQRFLRSPSSCVTSAGVRPPGGWLPGSERSMFGSTSVMAVSAVSGSPPAFRPLAPPRSAAT